MKSNQYSIKVFETAIEDEDKFITFIDVNYELFKHHLISIQGHIPQKVLDFLNDRSLKYVNNFNLPKAKKIKDNFVIVAPQEQESETEYKIISEPLRSGQFIEHSGDVLITERVNSGAKIVASGNIIALSVVNGDISSAGAFIVIGKTERSNIIFNGVKIDNTLLENRLNKIEFIDDEIVIKAISKKELTWV
ncbi:MAG: septum site-determining protein MinC [Campylobacterota bacterium]|nr:septum site-determining protein MinC [Campylobacterota bacterium]